MSKSEESEPLGRSSDCVAASGGFLLLLRPRAEDTFDSGELITISWARRRLRKARECEV